MGTVTDKVYLRPQPGSEERVTPGVPERAAPPITPPLALSRGLPTPPRNSTPAHPESLGAYLLYAAVFAIGAVPVLAIITSLWLFPTFYPLELHILMGAFALSFPLTVHRMKVPKGLPFLRFLAVAGVALAVVSYLTGGGNGLTDEPYTTPRYLGILLQGQNPYSVPLVFQYTEYGHTFLSASTYVYLPLLMFLQVPFLDYKIFAMGCWIGVVWLVRRNFYTTVALAQPYAALMAASGFNDLPVLLLLTLAFVGIGGRRQKWAEVLSLGVKQFANVVVFLYYGWKRDWKRLGVSVGVTVAFALPFLLWNSNAFICRAIVYNKLPGCVGYGTYIPWALNYSLYPLWVAAVFYVPILAYLRSLRASETSTVVRESIRRAWSLRARFLAYALIGASGVLINLIVFSSANRLLGSTVPWILLASSVAFVLALLWNFLWNYVWTFRGMRHRPVHHHLGLYAVIQVVALGINLGILDLWTGHFGADAGLVGQFVGVLAGSAWGFGANVRWNFRARAHSIGPSPHSAD